MNTSQSIFLMNDQHRATESEWYCLEARTCGDKSDVVAYSCILELRDRIEALEAAQQAHADASHVIDPEREKAAQELAQPAGFAPQWSEFARCAASIDALNEVKPAKSNHPAKADSSLVHRVACAFYTYGSGDGFREEARDAIREIAAWMGEQGGPIASGWAMRLEREAER